MFSIKHTFAVILSMIVLVSCTKGTDPKLLQDVSTYNATTHQQYMETYLSFVVALKAGGYEETGDSINKFMTIQETASAFWKGLEVPPEAEGYKVQMLDSFVGAKAIDKRYEQYTQAYKSFLQTVFPKGEIASQ